MDGAYEGSVALIGQKTLTSPAPCICSLLLQMQKYTHALMQNSA